ncbi:MAG: glycosyltransferase family 2 protein [Ginsengibacter sp.]
MVFSIIIITKNEQNNIGRTLSSIKELSDDIIIVDSGSTDETLTICKEFNCRIIETDWKGYGETKNIGNQAAKYDWILSIDADESVGQQLSSFLLSLSPDNNNLIYLIRIKNFFCQKLIRFGSWGNDNHLRFFNRKNTKWNNAAVHESLVFEEPPQIKKANGYLLHYTYNTIQEYLDKVDYYSKLNAEKYYRKGKKATFVKLYISPAFTFVKDYFFKGGILDGRYGLLIARISARGTKLKYQYLKEMIANKIN